MKRLSDLMAYAIIVLLSLCCDVKAQQRTLAGFQKQVQRRLVRDQAARIEYINVIRNTTGEIDQKKFKRAVKRTSEVDEQNVVWLRKQVAKIGMPDPAVIGQKCADGLFLLILHADRDREFQRECIKLMKKAPRQWPEARVKTLEMRASMPPPMKINLSDPEKSRKDTGKDKAAATEDSMKSTLEFPPQQVDPTTDVQEDDAREPKSNPTTN